MKKFVSTAFFWVSVFVPILAWSAPIPIDFTKDSGEIQGTLDYCGSSSEGIEVSIPGKSFMARTDYQGKFTLSYVPEGIWNLVFNKKGQRLGSMNGVEVLRRSLTDLDISNGPILLCSDLDGDGYTPDQDCNDANIRVYPGAPELCGNGLDDNCVDGIDEGCPECSDYDGDGYYAQVGCGFVDCDDANTLINPGAPETCGDGVDNDCDGQADEADANDAMTYYEDFDGDGYGNDFTTQTACNPPEGYALTGGDCDDGAFSINPGRQEICNGIDDNCDGSPDNDCSNLVCSDADVNAFETCMATCESSYQTCGTNCLAEVSEQQCASAILSLASCTITSGCVDAPSPELCAYDNCPDQWEAVFGNYFPAECMSGVTVPCGTTDVGACQLGTQDCVDGRWSECIGNIEPEEEICGDDIDNDCNSVPDDCSLTCDVGWRDCNGIPDDGCEVDFSNDPENCGGCGNACGTTSQCVAGSCEMDMDGDGYPSSIDCDDNDPNTYPEAPEICDGRTNNCYNNASPTAEEIDNDSDGYVECMPWLGSAVISGGGDCDDTNYNISPDMFEICGNGIDDNCTGETDEIGCL